MRFCLLLTLGLLAAGCAEDEVGYREVKRLDERVSKAELQAFLNVIESLPGKRLPTIPAHFSSTPTWSITRTLPVQELVVEEHKAIQERASIAWLASHSETSPGLFRALRREGLTLDQFVGLAVVLGTTMSLEAVPENRNLEQIESRGKRIVQALARDERVFSSLPAESAYYVLNQAAWLPLLDRVQKLRQVIPENSELVRNHMEQLKAVFPVDVQLDPLAEFTKVLEDRGTPFEELATSGDDSLLRWSREQAIIGTDAVALPAAPAGPSR